MKVRSFILQINFYCNQSYFLIILCLNRKGNLAMKIHALFFAVFAVLLSCCNKTDSGSGNNKETDPDEGKVILHSEVQRVYLSGPLDKVNLYARGAEELSRPLTPTFTWEEAEGPYTVNLADNPNYIDPLHDFTYYNNMNSRFYYTDFSLPYMITGGNKDELDAEDKADTYTWYDNDCFLSDIESYDYDIRILTEKKYVDKFVDTNPVKNYEEDSVCILDEEKTLSHFANAIRYRNMPFIL